MSGNDSVGHGPGLRKPANPITLSQVEVVASTAASVLGLVFGLQTIPALLDQYPLMATASGLALIVAVFGSLILAGLAAIFRQWTGPIFGLVAAVYLIALVAWPFVVEPLTPGDVPWIFYLCNVGTGCAVVAARSRWALALVYTIVTPAVLGWVRSTGSGGDVGVLAAWLDALYCFFIGLVMLVIVVALRQAAHAVDQAQGYALESYASAVREHATENERVRVDALVHDNVLITLLSAARARSPESKALAARMARSAITHLRDAQTTFPAARDDIDVEELVGRLRMAATEQARAFDVHMGLVDGMVVPSPVADAITEAATQAMVNSVNHAERPGHPVNRSLRVSTRSGPAPTLVIEVVDDGVGFDPASIPPERLGVRTSIVERMEKAGGRARIVAAPGAGATVRLIWPAPEADEDDEAEILPVVVPLDIVGERGGDWS